MYTRLAVESDDQLLSLVNQFAAFIVVVCFKKLILHTSEVRFRDFVFKEVLCGSLLSIH